MKPSGKELQQLYNEICGLMSLAYPGPSSDLNNVFGHDAFLEALHTILVFTCASWTRFQAV